MNDMDHDVALPPRDSLLALKRGIGCVCPACGQVRMFRALLKVNDNCPACGEALHHHRADDFPAYLNIILVGHIVVPLVLFVETAFAPAYWIHLVIWLPLTLILAFALMHPIKGAVVAWQWAMRMHGFDPAGDKNDPLPTVTTSKCAN